MTSYAAGYDFNGTTPLIQQFYFEDIVGTRLYFNISIYDDDIVEKNETFYVILDDSDLKVYIDKAVVYIIDDDSELTLHVNVCLT